MDENKLIGYQGKNVEYTTNVDVSQKGIQAIYTGILGDVKKEVVYFTNNTWNEGSVSCGRELRKIHTSEIDSVKISPRSLDEQIELFESSLHVDKILPKSTH